MRTYEQVKRIFEDNGCTLLEKNYKNNSTKMRYIAQCGHEHSITLSNFMAGKGRVCKKCRYKKVSKKNSYSYQYVYDYFEKERCYLITKEYRSANDQKLEYIAQCGHTNYMTFTKFKEGGGRVCGKCSRSVKYEYDYVVEAFENKDCLLLEDTYVNGKTKMKYIAQCGHESTISFDVFLNAKAASLKCKKCQKVTHYSYDDVKRYFSRNNCELLSTNYINGDQKLEYIPECGHKTTISFYKFLAGQGRVCPKCAKPRGERHHAYNPDLTDEDRLQRDMQNGELKKLRMEAYKRDHYTCQICQNNKGGNLEAHHIVGWSKDESLRFKLDNLITLCKKCHKEFHHLYGYGNNTKEQFEDFKKNKKNETRSPSTLAY